MVRVPISVLLKVPISVLPPVPISVLLEPISISPKSELIAKQ